MSHRGAALTRLRAWWTEGRRAHDGRRRPEPASGEPRGDLAATLVRREREAYRRAQGQSIW